MGPLRFTPDTVSSLQSISKHYSFCGSPIDYSAITLRRLLSHWSGLQHEAVGNSAAPYSPPFAAHMASIFETWLRFPPGERYAYSNVGIDLAGHAMKLSRGSRFRRSFAKRYLSH